MQFARLVLVIMMKDLRAELRTKEAINASLAFALVILIMFSFAFDPQEETTREISGGLLWIVFAFAGTLILNRSFARELPNDSLDALIAAPVSGPILFLGKAEMPCDPRTDSVGADQEARREIDAIEMEPVPAPLGALEAGAVEDAGAGLARVLGHPAQEFGGAGSEEGIAW